MTADYHDLAGLGALVTGASGGLGSAIARELARLGCKMFLTGRDPVRLDSLRDELGPTAGRCAVDLADGSAPQLIAEAALEHLGVVDVLVNNAGVFPVGPAENVTPQEFDSCFSVNVRAPFLLSSLLVPRMAARGWGRVVNIGSSSSYAGFANTALYCASKHALLGLSRSLFNEFKGRGVRVFCLSPGSIQTEMGRRVPGQTFETFIRPEEVARYLSNMIAFDAEMISEEVRLNRMEIR